MSGREEPDVPRTVFAAGDDHASRVAFAEAIAGTRRPVPVAKHTYGSYRFEHARADRVDAELGVALRLIEPALLRADAPVTDRP